MNAQPAKPASKYLLRVIVCGHDAGAYEYDTLAEAEAAKADREKRFEVLGVTYRIVQPSNNNEQGNQLPI